MVASERERLALYGRLKEVIGVDNADTFFGLLPRAGFEEVATRADLERWTAAAKSDLDQWRAATQADLEAWRAATKADLDQWRAATKADLDQWRADTKADLDHWCTVTRHEMQQRLAHLRENLKTPALREEFERANQFRGTGQR